MNALRYAMVREVTEDCLSLDVRELARDGFLEPGTTDLWRWYDPDVFEVVAATILEAGDRVLKLHTWVSHSDEPTHPQHIELTTTPCTYGGGRQWFVCPGCGKRRAVLYVPHRFGDTFFDCRECLNLAYLSTRESGALRRERRFVKLVSQMERSGLRHQTVESLTRSLQAMLPEIQAYRRWRIECEFRKLMGYAPQRL